MSLLTETLNRIRAYIERNYPESLVAMPPGLQLSQIQNMVENLPFKLPNEFYELYQWSCGIDEETSCNFYSFMLPFNLLGDTFYLLKLEQTDYEDIAFENEYRIVINYLGQPLFPVFSSEVAYIFLVGSVEEQKDSPIILWEYKPELNLTFQYTNLTSMMLTLAEYLETRPLNKKGTLHYDEGIDDSIYRKNNQELPNLSITNILQYLSTANLEVDKLASILSHFYDQVCHVRGCWEDFSFDQFSSELIEPLVAATQHEDEYIRSQAIEILNIFRGISYKWY